MKKKSRAKQNFSARVYTGNVKFHFEDEIMFLFVLTKSKLNDIFFLEKCTRPWDHHGNIGRLFNQSAIIYQNFRNKLKVVNNDSWVVVRTNHLVQSKLLCAAAIWKLWRCFVLIVLISCRFRNAIGCVYLRSGETIRLAKPSSKRRLLSQSQNKYNPKTTFGLLRQVHRRCVRFPVNRYKFDRLMH